MFRKVGRNVLLSTSSRPGRPPPGSCLQGCPEPESQIYRDRPYPPWVARRRSLTWRRSLGREHPWCPRRMREWVGGMGEGGDVREGKTTRPRARRGSPLRTPPLIHRFAPPNPPAPPHIRAPDGAPGPAPTAPPHRPAAPRPGHCRPASRSSDTPTRAAPRPREGPSRTGTDPSPSSRRDGRPAI